MVAIGGCPAGFEGYPTDLAIVEKTAEKEATQASLKKNKAKLAKTEAELDAATKQEVSYRARRAEDLRLSLSPSLPVRRSDGLLVRSRVAQVRWSPYIAEKSKYAFEGMGVTKDYLLLSYLGAYLEIEPRSLSNSTADAYRTAG